jgi:hypothetical protein
MHNVSDNPFGPPERFDDDPFAGAAFPAPPRRRWPSWLIVTVALVSGLALGAASSLGVYALGSADPAESSSQASGPGGGGPNPGPSTPGGSLSIDFPDGTTATFVVPDGLHHDADQDDDGHVALAGDGDSAAYLDVYTDETTGSKARNLPLTAAQAQTDDRNHGNTAGAITYRSVGGHQAAQYRLTHHDDDGSFDALVTVILVGQETIGLYWSDDSDDFAATDGQRNEAAVLHSLRVSGGDGSANTASVRA